MRKVKYLYADFETLRVNIPEKYKSPLKYYQEDPNPKTSKYYSWAILWDKEYGDIGLRTNTSKESAVGYIGLETENKYEKQNHFIHTIEQIDVDSIMYFNNLRAFDGHFIIPALDSNGYTYIPPFDLNEIDYLPAHIQRTYRARVKKIRDFILKHSKTVKENYNFRKLEDQQDANRYLMGQIERRWKRLLPKEYSLLTDENGNIYEIKIGLSSLKRSKNNKNNRALIIRDNLYLFPASIKKMGENLVKQHIHEHGEDSKTYAENLYLKKELSTGYERTDFYKSWKEFENDGNEKEYLIQDVFILYMFHKKMEKFLPRSKWGMTIGSSAYKEWLITFGNQLVDLHIDKGEIAIKKLKRGAIRYIYKDQTYTTTNMYKRLVDKYLPTRWLDKKVSKDETTHQDLFKWYNGGLTRVNEDYRGQFVENITAIDKNSHYPSQMVSDNFVPIGYGLKGDVKGYDFKFYTLTPLKDIKNEHGLPFLNNEDSDNIEYLRVLKAGSQYRFTSIKYKRFLKYYKCKRSDYKLVVNYSFQQVPISKLFKKYINHWYEFKVNADSPLMREIAKLNLNNVYGKFGMKSVRVNSIWDQESQEWIKNENLVDSKYYLPLAIAITELGQVDLVDSIGFNHKNFVYCDTDSLFIKDWDPKDYPHIKLHPSALDHWDVEFKGYGIVRRPKQYLFKNSKGEEKFAYAGVNLNAYLIPDEEEEFYEETKKQYKNITFQDMIFGKTISNQSRAYKILGKGVLIQDIDKTIPPIWAKEYGVLVEQKFFLPEHFSKSLLKMKQF